MLCEVLIVQSPRLPLFTLVVSTKRDHLCPQNVVSYEPRDRFRTRVVEAFGAMILTLMTTVGGVIIRSAQEATPATEPATSLSIDLTLGLITSLPRLVTLAGIIAATLVAGPFGFVGALLETAGATQLLHSSANPVIPSERRSGESTNSVTNRLDAEITLSYSTTVSYATPTMSCDFSLS